MLAIRKYIIDCCFDGKPINMHQPQENQLPKEKVYHLTFRRVVKRAIKHQPHANPHQSTTDKPISDKKTRREEKKKQIKMQKKAGKKEKRDAKMDVEDEWLLFWLNCILSNIFANMKYQMNYHSKHAATLLVSFRDQKGPVRLPYFLYWNIQVWIPEFCQVIFPIHQPNSSSFLSTILFFL